MLYPHGTTGYNGGVGVSARGDIGYRTCTLKEVEDAILLPEKIGQKSVKKTVTDKAV
jgi:hypothetical protein